MLIDRIHKGLKSRVDFASLTKECEWCVCVCTYVHKGVCILVLAGFVLSAIYTGGGYSCVPSSDNVKHLVVPSV